MVIRFNRIRKDALAFKTDAKLIKGETIGTVHKDGHRPGFLKGSSGRK
jgi:hypothetical protein